MRSLALVMALASTALATPAVARDQTWYAGVEGGLVHVEDADFDVSGDGVVETEDFLGVDHKTGLDLDIIGGYDFGLFRAEFEAGYKRASIDAINFRNTGENADSSGNVRVYSVMGNAFLDFGDDDGWGAYAGGGVGLANARYKLTFNDVNNVGNGSDRDRSFAYQAIFGIRRAIGSNVDVGVKYRYFVAPNLDFDIVGGGEASTKFRSHSLLASLVFNFAPPPAPVVVAPVVETPPPPPPPATQTCYDGSVILATEVCPQPPVETPPPAPEPAPERG